MKNTLNGLAEFKSVKFIYFINYFKIVSLIYFMVSEIDTVTLTKFR